VGGSLKLIAAVLIACVASALGLGATYGVTRDRIAEQERIAEQRSLREAFEGADEFERIEDEAVLDAADEAGDDVVEAVYRALDEGGEHVGWGLRVAPRGYGGPIRMVVGLTRNGEVTGVSIISLNETPGLGTQVSEPGFLAQFGGWDAGTIEEEAKGMDAVSGATKSSNAVRKGLLAAGHVYQQVLGDREGGE
jgi:electron transport complex protein RnfG